MKVHRVVEATERRMLKSLRQKDQHRWLEALRGCADVLVSAAGPTASGVRAIQNLDPYVKSLGKFSYSSPS